MFRFAEPQYLYLLLLVPTLIVLFLLYLKGKRKRMELFGDTELLQRMTPFASPKRVRNKFILIVLAVILLTLALARPQFGANLKEVNRNGVEIMLVVDVSNSMMAEDLKPNRLERTKLAISQLIDKLSEDRIGMVVFAGDAYVQLPITSDYVSAKTFVRSLSTDMVPRQGTSIASAIELATRSFSEKSERSRAMILISDGESHEGEPLQAAQHAKEASVIVYTVGLGTPDGAPITMGGDMIKDSEGEIVVTKLDEQLLQQIAVLTGGAYVRANESSMGLDKVVTEIDKLEKLELTSVVFDQFSEQFHYLVIIALIMLLADIIMIERKNKILSKISIFKK